MLSHGYRVNEYIPHDKMSLKGNFGHTYIPHKCHI